MKIQRNKPNTHWGINLKKEKKKKTQKKANFSQSKFKVKIVAFHGHNFKKQLEGLFAYQNHNRATRMMGLNNKENLNGF